MKQLQKRFSRRNLLLISAALCLGTINQARAQEADVEINIVLDYGRGLWYYDPVGVFIQPGQTVKWTALRWTPSVTAFHPDNDNHELRIPEGAQPFDSGMLAAMESFQWTFEVEGTYDYFSKHHEGAGLLGRIVVGSPGGPGERDPRYGGAEGSSPIYRQSMTVFGEIDSREIVEKKSVAFPKEKLAKGMYRRRR